MTTIVLSKEECYKSLPDFYEVLADKVSKCNGGSRPTIDRRNISVTPPCIHRDYKMPHTEVSYDGYRNNKYILIIRT